MKYRLLYKQIAYSITLFGFLLGLYYLKSNIFNLEGDWIFLLHYFSSFVFGIILGCNWIIHLSKQQGSLKVMWYQIIFVTIPAAILYLMPYIAASPTAAFLPGANEGLFVVLLQPGLTMLAGVVLGYSLISSLRRVAGAE